MGFDSVGFDFSEKFQNFFKNIFFVLPFTYGRLWRVFKCTRLGIIVIQKTVVAYLGHFKTSTMELLAITFFGKKFLQAY